MPCILCQCYTVSDQEKLEYAKQLHSAVGLDHMQRVSFPDVTKFEKYLNVKIIIFYHAAGHKRQTIWLYLHNEHY